MRILTSTNGRWLKPVTSVGSIPLLLAQVLIGLVCVPETLNAGTEIRRGMTWEELPAFLAGEKKVTVVLSAGGPSVAIGCLWVSGNPLIRLDMTGTLAHFMFA